MHLKSPLIKDDQLNQLLFKLENIQPGGSFKIRGIFNLINTTLLNRNISQVIASSGGNAGIATILSCRKLGLKVSYFLLYLY
jgi:L-serine/L-threonine ammonia-lyase